MSSAEYAKDLLRSGIIDAKTGNKESARRYLDRAIYMAESHDVLAEAWFWMSEVVGEPAEKRKTLENCRRIGCERAQDFLPVSVGHLRPRQRDLLEREHHGEIVFELLGRRELEQLCADNLLQKTLPLEFVGRLSPNFQRSVTKSLAKELYLLGDRKLGPQ